jgi:hypothetical protein
MGSDLMQGPCTALRQAWTRLNEATKNKPALTVHSGTMSNENSGGCRVEG